MGSLNGKSVELVGSFANYDLYYSGSWIVYFSVSKEFYAEFIKAKKVGACFGVLIDGKLTDPYDSDRLPYAYSVDVNVSESTLAPDSKDISTLSVSSISNKTYSGKAKTPDVKIKDGNYTLKKDTDYTFTYKNNKNIGKATVTITGKGKYSGTKTVTFKIIPKKTTLTVKKTDEKYTFSWGKVSGVDKYQIYYSTDGKNYTKLANISSKKTSYSTTKLDESKTYSFKIRSYKKVDGKTYYSKFSKVVKK